MFAVRTKKALYRIAGLSFIPFTYCSSTISDKMFRQSERLGCLHGLSGTTGEVAERTNLKFLSSIGVGCWVQPTGGLALIPPNPRPLSSYSLSSALRKHARRVGDKDMLIG